MVWRVVDLLWVNLVAVCSLGLDGRLRLQLLLRFVGVLGLLAWCVFVLVLIGVGGLIAVCSFTSGCGWLNWWLRLMCVVYVIGLTVWC